ncbi:3'(2'),5'-bisphosphate nucleotidase CysQ [Aestuariivivens sediminicola]|uniref:3'(2'),5'-bisphosphate nucleotidase CysQ n=1 Tax=Aestuariivivens sediminicola TaxID=2913560 RepID=UPI001F587554|nr:3'(2'),5'-bisphosphate nucleotidase CysQ [Aestuariivivens sediminicola]
MLTYGKYLNTAIRASLLAGAEILNIYESDFSISYKEDASPLTEADIASNNIIKAHLEPTNIPVISEESRQMPYDKRKQWQACWIVDPIDGTKEFIKRNGEFTVNIALVVQGQPMLGVIYVPVSSELYYTDGTKTKAYRSVVHHHNEELKTLLFKEKDALKPRLEKGNTLRVVGSRSHMNAKTLQYLNVLKHDHDAIEIVSKGSSLKFCLMAEGKADLYPRFAPTMEWDTAAGQAICEAVGLKVIDQRTMQPMVYNRESLLNNHFLVSY